MLLQKFSERARQAHAWVSFSPERRGDQTIQEHSAELQGDIDNIWKLGSKYGIETSIIADHTVRYQSNYERFFSSWLASKSRCISSMITGPARFPVDRARKYNEWEHNKYVLFQDFRAKAMKSIERSFKPAVTVESELDRYRRELSEMEERHEHMKRVNEIIRKAKGEDCTQALVAEGVSHGSAYKMQSGDFAGRKGYAQFNLTNNLANMKRVRERIALMEKKQERIEDGSNGDTAFEGGRIVVNHAEDRIQILYDEKPDKEKIAVLKKHAFNFSFRNMAWQRKITVNAVHAAAAVTGVPSSQIKIQ